MENQSNGIDLTPQLQKRRVFFKTKIQKNVQKITIHLLSIQLSTMICEILYDNTSRLCYELLYI